MSVSFLADFMLYVIYTAIPFRALRLGADPLQLGLLAAISTGTYALLSPVFGRLADGGNRMRKARATCVVICVGCVSLTLAPSVGWMLLCVPLIGGGMAPFWTGVQASLADRSTLGNLSHNLGLFNLCWSTGKACGFLVGGALVATSGAPAAWTLACFLAFAIFFVLPQEFAKTDDAPTTTTPAELAYDPRAPVFRSMAWIANSVAFGLGATLNHHYPRLVQEFGWSPSVFGLFLGGIFVCQSLTFLLLRRFPDLWRFRRGRLYAIQALMLVAMLALPLADLPRVLLSAVVFGAGLGTCYYSSIYYSLHAGAARGRNAGVHESLIGVGSMLMPLLGGWMARATGILAAPYMVAGVLVGFALLLQEGIFQRSRRRLS